MAPMVVDAPTTHAHDQATGAEDTDDVVFVGRTGDLALSDFPHCRENCVNHKFVPGREAESCSNCFCYVCAPPRIELESRTLRMLGRRGLLAPPLAGTASPRHRR